MIKIILALVWLGLIIANVIAIIHDKKETDKITKQMIQNQQVMNYLNQKANFYNPENKEV